MHAFDVPEAASPQLLLQCLALADQYGVEVCFDPLLNRLQALLTPEKTDLSTLALIFAAPPGVQAQPTFWRLLGTAKRAVIHLFGEAPAVAGSEQLRQQFCSLPFAALHSWAQSGELRVHSENDVVFLMSAWVKAAQAEGGQGVSAEQLEQLAHSVRVLRLCRGYQYDVLTQLSWFRQCSGFKHYQTLLAYKGQGAFPDPALQLPAVTSSAGWWAGPPAWVAPQRKVFNPPATILTWTLCGRELQQLFNDRDIHSPTVYRNGFMLQVRSKAVSVPTAAAAQPQPGCTLSVSCSVAGQAMADAGVPWGDGAAVIMGGITLKVGGDAAANQAAAQQQLGRVLLNGGGASQAFPNVLGSSAATLQELLAPHLKDGQLCIQAQFSAVDSP